MLSLLAGGAAVVLVHATLWFAVSIPLRRNDVADIAWGLGFILLSLYLLLAGTVDSRDVLLAVLVTLWGVRLAVHIAVRGRGKGEDFRYRDWREEWGSRALARSYLQVFVLQGLILLVIAAPLFLSARVEGPPLDGWALAGATIWAVGLFFEAVGDEQLRRFKSGPANRGRIMTEGLWRYTRHPNYFGEVTLWVGLFLIVVPVEYGVWAIVSPLVLLFLLLKVSGIPMLERRYEGNPEFEAYRERTSAFVPLPPRGTSPPRDGQCRVPRGF